MKPERKHKRAKVTLLVESRYGDAWRIKFGGLPLEIFRRWKFSAYSCHENTTMHCTLHSSGASRTRTHSQRQRWRMVNYRETVFNSLPKLAVRERWIPTCLVRCAIRSRAHLLSKNVLSTTSIRCQPRRPLEITSIYI